MKVLRDMSRETGDYSGRAPSASAISIALAAALALTASACGPASEATTAAAAGDQAPAAKASAAPSAPSAPMAAEALIGYDLRRLRPRDGETLAAMFERVRAQALADGKRSAVLFSAEWCAPCRRLEAELGNLQPAEAIGDVRIFELKEEDWTQATRMDEFNGLRTRWYPKTGSYPVLVLLDGDGAKVEEMKEAIERLEGEGIEATLANWLRTSRV